MDYFKKVLPEKKQKLVEVYSLIPVSYTHLDVYKRQLLDTLDRILTKGSKENKNIFIENQHKIKLDKGTIKSLE